MYSGDDNLVAVLIVLNEYPMSEDACFLNFWPDFGFTVSGIMVSLLILVVLKLYDILT